MIESWHPAAAALRRRGRPDKGTPAPPAPTARVTTTVLATTTTLTTQE